MTQAVRAMRLTLVVAVCAAFASVGSAAHADVGAQGCSAHAVVVVEPGPGATTICFDGSISGIDALQLAGANPVTYGFSGQGAAVCQLFGVGNPADGSCLVGPGGQYWAYYRAAPGTGGWTYSRGGASSTTVVDGSVEGWRYGTGGAPGFVPFCSVVSCAPPATDPPPPVIAAPAPAQTPAPPGPGATTAPSDTTRPGASVTPAGGDKATSNNGEPKGSGSTSATSTTKGSDRAGSTGSRRAASVEVAAGPGRGGGDSGSPLGVVVAGSVLVVGAGAAVWLRRRRQGPAPG
jgi:hypothetical protein